MAGQNGGRGGKGKSPRYSDRYGANRPNPYTGYLPPGSAPAGQLYHPESVNMEKVSQMMTENASNLAAAAVSRVAGEADVKDTMDNENTTSTTPVGEQPEDARQSQGGKQNGGHSQQRNRSKHRKNGGSAQSAQREISEEQRQKLQTIQEEAAAEMVAEVLSESIIGAAAGGSASRKSEVSAADIKEAQPAAAADDVDWSNMRITTKFKRGGGKREDRPFDPDRFDDAEVRENPFDANYFSEDESSARFVPPLEIFDTDDDSDDVQTGEFPEQHSSDKNDDGAAASTVAETADGEDGGLEDDSTETMAADEECAEDDVPDEMEDISVPDSGEEAIDKAGESETEDDTVDDESAEDITNVNVPEYEEPSSADDYDEAEDSAGDDVELSEWENDDVGDEIYDIDETFDDIPCINADPDETDEDEDDIGDTDDFNGVDWETPDDLGDEDDGQQPWEPEDEDSDMIIVDDVRSDIIERAVMPVAERERSILRVSSESYTPDESDKEQDDTLFIKQERVNGGTEVFNLPEGVKLPTYIDDDEFLEQWLNEGEDMAIKDKRRRRRVSTIIGTLTMLFAMVGFVWVIQYAFSAIAGIGNTDETKDKYTEFIAPVVMSEVQPFESWSAIPAEKLLQSAIFHVLTNMEESYYETDDTNKIVIPSGDVADAVKKLYGSEAALGVDSLDILDSDDAYYSDTDDCFHVAATGISGPQPEIISISKKGSEITLMVGYLDETGITSTDGYYLTMQYILGSDGDDIYIKAIRSVETSD